MKGEMSMNFSNVSSVMQMAYQYQNRTQKTSVNGNSFTNSLQEARRVEEGLSRSFSG